VWHCRSQRVLSQVSKSARPGAPSSVSRDDAQAEIERIAREVLTNPVIEEYSFKLEG